jgi:hypothetical protein
MLYNSSPRDLTMACLVNLSSIHLLLSHLRVYGAYDVSCLPELLWLPPRALSLPPAGASNDGVGCARLNHHHPLSRFPLSENGGGSDACCARHSYSPHRA